MATQIVVDFTGEEGVNPRLCRMVTTEILATILTPGFLNKVGLAGITFLPTDFLMTNYNDGAGGTVNAVFTLEFAASGIITIILPGGGEGTVTSVNGTDNQIGVEDPDTTPRVFIVDNPIIPGTAAMTIPGGNTSQRPISPSNGDFRANKQVSVFEGYIGDAWHTFATADGFVAAITGTENQINVDATVPTNPILSIPTNPILPGNVTANSFNSIGGASIAGTGTVDVTNGSDFVNGTGTTFTQNFGTNSSIRINSGNRTVKVVYSDNSLQLIAPYDDITASGLPYFFDAPYFSMTNSAGTHVADFTNSGALIYYNFPAISYQPSIIPSTLGGVTSSYTMQSDVLNFNFDAGGSFNISAFGLSELNLIFNISGAGNVLTAGDMTLGMGATPGQTLFLPTNSFDTYSPYIKSSNDGSFSKLSFQSDQYYFNMIDGKNFEVNGNILTKSLTSRNSITSNFTVSPQSIVLGIDGGDLPLITFGNSGTLQFDGSLFNFSNPITAPTATFSSATVNSVLQVNGEIIADNSTAYADKMLLTGVALDSSTDSGGVSLVLTHNSASNRQFGLTASENLLIPPDSTHAIARWVLGGTSVDFSVVSTDGSVNLPLYFQRDFGPSEFFGFLSVGNNLPAYKLDIQDADAAIRLDGNTGIPTAPPSGVVFFSNFDIGLGHSIAFYIDDAGNVTQIGAGSGGSGTVTEVDTTSDLTVNGVPGGSFTVDGTLGLADKSGATAATYQFPQITLDAKGRVSNASNLGSYNGIDFLLILNGTGLSAHTSITNAVLIGDNADASDDSISNFVAIGKGSRAGNQGTCLGVGAGNLTTGHDIHLFLGYGADATTNNLTNVAAIGPHAEVSQDNTYGYGDPATPVSHGLNIPNAQSTLHVKSGPTSGSIGSKGVLRLNGINDPANNWPVSDWVKGQNAEITSNGVSVITIASIPISNALGGCHTKAKIQISAIIGGGGPAAASAQGEIDIRGFFDDVHDTFWINGVSTTTPIPITLVAGSTDLTISSVAIAQVVLSGTAGPGSQSILVQIIGISTILVNWNCVYEYFTTQATANI